MSAFTESANALTGLAGTVGGLSISYLGLRHAWRKDRHEITVEAREAILLTPKFGTSQPDFSENMFTIKVANTGSRDFTLTTVGIQVGKRTAAFYINEPLGTVKLPYILTPYNTCNFWTEYAPLFKDVKKKAKNRSHIKVRVYIGDYVGNSFYSNWITMRFKETQGFKIRKWFKDQFRKVQAYFFP